MPIIFLSPSTQEYNAYVNDLGTEEEWMNHLADAMEPILFASGIQYTRNDRDQTAAAAIRPSTPTPPARGRRGRTRGSSPSTSLAAPGGCGRPSSWPMG